MIPVRQSTAFETAIGPVLDADGVAVTGCVVGDFKIKKTSGNFAALNASATLTHVSAGVYDLVLTTSDVDTVGLACVAIDDTVNGCASLYLQVMEEAVYDRDYAASATGYIASQPVDLNTIKTQAVTCGAGVTVLASVGTAATSTAQTGDGYAIVNSGTHGNAALKTLIDAVDNFVDTEITALQTSVDDLPTNSELATALGTADDAVLAQVALVKAKTDLIPPDPADASDIAAAFSTVNTTLSTIAGYLDTEIAAIKTKTDQLTFTIANVLDANIQRVNDVVVNGAGTALSPWGP